MSPYTYLIGWTELNRWYYGVQYGRKAHPSNLWVTYFTSSKEVKKFRIECGEPDVIEVRKIFDDDGAARLWEEKVLRRLRAPKSELWLNRSYGNKKFYATPEHLDNLHANNIGRKHSEETRQKLSAANTGRKQNEEWKRKRCDKLKGRSRPDSVKLAVSRSRKGQPPESAAHLNVKVACPVCGAVTNKANIVRWHKHA